MAQLKDTTVSGSLRATDTIYSTTIQAQILKAPIASNGVTYGPGTNGQVLKSNGTSVYWGADNDSVTGVKGNSESSYRTGNVNITASNIGLGNVENTKLSTWTGSANITTVGTITSGTWNGTAISSAYIGSHTHSYAGSSSAGGAATSANALNFVNTNELLLGNSNSQTGIHINHRRIAGGASSGNTAITDYYFKNGNGAITGVKIHAETFNGNLSGNATSAATLTTARTLWGQSFDGSANVTGNLIDVGNQIRLLSGQTELQFLTSDGKAANGKFGKLGLNATYSNVDFTNYVLDVNGATRLVGQVKINYTTAATTTTQSGQLIITSGTSTNNVSIELYRNSGASWQIYNNSGTLYFNNNYTTSAQSTYSKTALSLAYNTGNATFSGTATFGGNVTMPTDSTLTIGSGTLTATNYSGNAATATKWYAAQKVYVALGTASKTETIQGGNSSAEIIGVDGTLAETNGGTGQNTYTKGQILYASAANTLSKLDIGTAGYTLQATANGPAWTQKVAVANGGTNATSVTKYGIAYGNSSADAYAFTSAGTDGYILIGKGTSAAPAWQEILPISHGGTGTKTAPTQYGVIYASSTTSYASTDAGAANHMLVGVASGAPKWTTVATLDSNASTTANTAAYDTLTLGNTAKVSTTTAHSEGRIYLYSANSKAHIIKGTATDTEYTHTLPNDTGVLVSLSGGTAKGSTTKPIYIPNTGIVTECDTYAGGTAVTLNGSSKAASTASFYAPTSSGTANYILASGGANASPTWITTASGALYATAADGAAQFGTLPVAQGGTGATSFTANSAIISGSTTTSALTTRGITDITTAGSNPTANTNLITANTLINYKGTTNIDTLGTITSGTWQGTTIGTGYGGTGVASHTANRLVYSTSATAIQATDKHYASDTQISINSTTAPDSGYALKVNGNLETAGLMNIITNTRTKDYYFSNGVPGNCGVVGRIMYDIGTGPNITKSLMCFIENSYSSTASATPIVYGEYYYLPACTAGLTQNLSYNILTTKSTVTVAQGGTGVTSHTANRLVWSTSATAIQATDAHYVSATQMSINFTSAPHSGYTLLVGGHSEINGALSLQQPNSSTQSLYFKNHTSTVLGVGARIYYWNGSASGITHSQLNFQEYSYSTTASATPLSFYEQYSLPDCNAGLSANAAYNIITTKNLDDIPNALRSRHVPSNTANFDAMTTAGVYDVINNITNGYPSTSGSNPKYGVLVVFTTHRGPSGTAGNVVLQVYYGNTPNQGQNQYLFTRAKYANTWTKWHQVTLTKLSV